MAVSCSSADVSARLFSSAVAFLVVASCPQSCHNIGRFFGGVVLPAVCSASAPITFFASVGFFCQPCGLTIHAPDARGVCPIFEYFSGFEFFHISSRHPAHPHAGNANRWLASQSANTKPSLNHKFRFIVEFRKTSSGF